MRRGLFLDRDGVINFDIGYPYKIEHLKIIHGVEAALNMFSKNEYELFVVSNQSGVGRGFFNERDVAGFNFALAQTLAADGIVFKEMVFCPHTASQNCACRKPSPKMLNDLIEKYNIDRSMSIMIGDKDSDVQAGKNAGILCSIKIEKNQPNALLRIAESMFNNT